MIGSLSRSARLGLVLLAPALLLAGCGDRPAGDAPAADAPAADAPAASQSADADLREIREYELSMDGIRKWYEANRNLQQAAEANPQLGDAMEREEEDEASLDDIQRRLESVPEARRAIEQAGLDVREYAVMSWALFQAGFAQAAVEQGANPDSLAREAGINRDNIVFVRDHKAELEQLQQQYAPAADD